MGAIKTYGIDCVVANELQSRRTKAFVYSNNPVQICECKEDQVNFKEIIFSGWKNR